MKIVMITFMILGVFGLSGCSSASHEAKHYNRSVQASEQAHDKFDKE